MRYLALPLLAVLSVPQIAAAQQTMREQVLTMGVSEEIVVAEYPALSLNALTAAAGAVVHVAVRSQDTFLSSDGLSILTDYRVTVLNAVKPSTGSPIDAGDVITIRRPGGVLSIEGRKVVSNENDFPPFAGGAEYVLFLKTDAGQPFEMLAGPQSAFRVRDGAATAMGPSTRAPSVVQMPILLHEIRGQVARGPHTASAPQH